MGDVDGILSFWLDEVGPDEWYKADDALDEEIRRRFLPLWEGACEGRFAMWLTYPAGSLAYIILTDQFPRNMFRGEGRAFATDRAALAAAKSAIHRKWDLRIDEPARQFFYLPLMHSENLCDQDRCVRLIHERMPETGADNLTHAKAHREVIRRFGRFPYRNAALGRANTAPERAFLDEGGYGAAVRELQVAV
ncbi:MULTISPECIES: DUF924 family protein [unclassified Rhodosalinus]|uniref:DUF924 family protein n=1 Tax=unclassified Rhodosalinus TaxID=2630183 RepID=UPI0035247C27